MGVKVSHTAGPYIPADRGYGMTKYITGLTSHSGLTGAIVDIPGQ